MIDIANEQLLPLNEVPKFLPLRGNGKRIHISAIYRWAQRGIRGSRLEVIRVGGTTYTSREALQRFASPTMMSGQPRQSKSTERQKHLDRVTRRLDEFLYGEKRRIIPETGVSQQHIDQMLPNEKPPDGYRDK